MRESLAAGTVIYETSEVAGLSPGEEESPTAGVTWGAIIAGAFAAAAVSVIMIALGAALGFSSVSPWPSAGASATAIGVAAVIWLVVTQWLSAGVGGYMAGRLRTKWAGLHSDEVFFRDTAHGFLAWAVGTVIGAALLATAAASVLGNTAQAGATIAAGVAQSATQAGAQGTAHVDPADYFADVLFRSDKPAPTGDTAANRAEVARIFAAGLRDGDISPDDRHYLAELVAARTGLSPADADKRVGDVIGQMKAAATDAANRARQAADAARKAAEAYSYAMCISLLVGAFIASVTGALGGRLRDENEAKLSG